MLCENVFFLKLHLYFYVVFKCNIVLIAFLKIFIFIEISLLYFFITCYFFYVGEISLLYKVMIVFLLTEGELVTMYLCDTKIVYVCCYLFC